MADNILTKDRTDADIALAAKDIGGVLFPRNILTDESGHEVSPATQATLAAIEAKLPALINSGLRMAGYDPSDDMMKSSPFRRSGAIRLLVLRSTLLNGIQSPALVVRLQSAAVF